MTDGKAGNLQTTVGKEVPTRSAAGAVAVAVVPIVTAAGNAAVAQIVTTATVTIETTGTAAGEAMIRSEESHATVNEEHSPAPAEPPAQMMVLAAPKSSLLQVSSAT
jgi:hypothetical protein